MCLIFVNNATSRKNHLFVSWFIKESYYLTCPCLLSINLILKTTGNRFESQPLCLDGVDVNTSHPIKKKIRDTGTENINYKTIIVNRYIRFIYFTMQNVLNYENKIKKMTN